MKKKIPGLVPAVKTRTQVMIEIILAAGYKKKGGEYLKIQNAQDPIACDEEGNAFVYKLGHRITIFDQPGHPVLWRLHAKIEDGYWVDSKEYDTGLLEFTPQVLTVFIKQLTQ